MCVGLSRVEMRATPAPRRVALLTTNIAMRPRLVPRRRAVVANRCGSVLMSAVSKTPIRAG